MVSSGVEVGVVFQRTWPAGVLRDVARKVEDGGLDQIWLVEDCLYTGGVSLAATALAVTERLRVGLGILPAVARNPAFTAMELATLDGLAPGRILPGIGHGVQSWMEQVGARQSSPVTTLEEVLVAVRRLLDGERVAMRGHHVHLDDAQLDQPPANPPPLLAGVRGPKSLAMAGRIADGLVLAEPASPSFVRHALDQAGRPADFHVAAFAAPSIARDRRSAYEQMAPWLANELDAPSREYESLPFFDELVALYADKGAEGLVTMPPDWWSEIGPIGTLDDAQAHIEALEAAGASSIALFLPRDATEGLAQIDAALALARR